jgi:hypothetical protein
MDPQTELIQQDQAITMGRAAYINQDNSGINTLLNDLTNVELDIEEVELLLQGMRLDPAGKEIKMCEPLCNKEGSSNVTRLMRAMVGRITLMSNFEEDQIRILIEELANDMVEDLTFNKVRYGITYPKAITTIVDLVSMKCFACGMSAKDNGTRKMLRGTTMETTINTQGAGLQTRKGGGIGSLLGLGRK